MTPSPEDSPAASDTPSAREVFAEALELAPESRAGYLDRACARRPDLRARVERLLATHARAGTFLADPTVTAPPDAPGEAPGQWVGPYRLLEQIGEGGFGAVFMAEQVEPIRRRVALKIIKLGMDTRQVIARFEAERQALAMMDHPSIARVLDAGATEGGRPYFVMELVRGEPITSYCDACRLSVRDRLELFQQVCHAVQHAHSKGVIHRDLKPGNVLVTEIDGHPVPKVIDFGIAKATGTDGVRLSDKSVVTEFRQFIGTLEYMSPEQAAMSGVDVDTRSDVYSLGVLLYELLSGSTPFEGRRLRSAALAEIQRIIAEEEPPRLSTRVQTSAGASRAEADTAASSRQTDTRTLTRALRGDLDWIANRCLEKHRARRYPTAEALAADIARYLRHEPVLAGPPGVGYRIRKFVRRHRAGVAIVAASGAALLLATAVAGHGLVEARRSAGEAARHAEVAKAVNEFLNRDVLLQIVPVGAGATGREVRLRDVLDAAGRRLDGASAPGGRFADKPLVEAGIRFMLGESLLQLGEPDAAESHLLRARDLIERHRAFDPDLPHRAALTVASLRRSQGRFEESAATLRQALEQRVQASASDDEVTASLRLSLAQTCELLDSYAEAEPLYQQAIEYFTRAKGQSAPDTLGAVNGLAEVYRYQRRFAEAEPLFRRLVDDATRTLGPDHPDTLGYSNNLGAVLWDQARYAEAEPYMRRVLEGTRRIHGPSHPMSFVACGNLANLLSARGERQGAEALYREAFAGFSSSLGPEHPSTLNAARSLAGCLEELGLHDEALDLLLPTLDSQRRTLGPEHLHTRRTMSYLALVYKSLGRFMDAEPLMVEGLELSRRLRGPEDLGTLGEQTNLASLYAATGRLDEALRILVPTLETKRRVLGIEHEFTRICMRQLAEVLERLGRPDEARPLRDELERWHAARRGGP